MIGLRIIGLVVGIYLLVTTVRKFRNGRRSAVDLFLFGMIAIALSSIALWPSLLDPFLESLSFTPGNYGRLVGLLILSIVLMFFVQLRLLDSVRDTDGQLTRLVQKLAIDQFLKRYPNKPIGEIAVLIPAYNEAGVIASVISKVPKSILGLGCNIIVIDDGSTDDTAFVAQDCGALVASHFMNRGGGAALGTGYTLVQKFQIPFVATIDADGQYVPEELVKLLEPVIAGKADFVVGSRLRGHYEGINDWRLLIRTIGLFLFNFAASILLCKVVTDIPSGFRAIQSSFLSSMKLTQKQFHTSEFLIEAIRSGARYKEVPISFLKRRVGESKKPPSLRYGWGFFKALFGTWLR